MKEKIIIFMFILLIILSIANMAQEVELQKKENVIRELQEREDVK